MRNAGDCSGLAELLHKRVLHAQAVSMVGGGCRMRRPKLAQVRCRTMCTSARMDERARTCWPTCMRVRACAGDHAGKRGDCLVAARNKPVDQHGVALSRQLGKPEQLSRRRARSRWRQAVGLCTPRRREPKDAMHGIAPTVGRATIRSKSRAVERAAAAACSAAGRTAAQSRPRQNREAPHTTGMRARGSLRTIASECAGAKWREG
jgi:hypothetical protein